MIPKINKTPLLDKGICKLIKICCTNMGSRYFGKFVTGTFILCILVYLLNSHRFVTKTVANIVADCCKARMLFPMLRVPTRRRNFYRQLKI